jgi:Cu+-exporting ATPase
VGQLAQMLRYAKTGKRIVTVSFILSILYNIVGLSFATQAKLSPLIAAILMPASSISIVVLVSLYARIAARRIRN